MSLVCIVASSALALSLELNGYQMIDQAGFTQIVPLKASHKAVALDFIDVIVVSLLALVLGFLSILALKVRQLARQD